MWIFSLASRPERSADAKPFHGNDCSRNGEQEIEEIPPGPLIDRYVELNKKINDVIGLGQSKKKSWFAVKRRFLSLSKKAQDPTFVKRAGLACTLGLAKW